eukprot:scaffold229277_cov26-Tisochrysis_lutea.AAC.1
MERETEATERMHSIGSQPFSPDQHDQAFVSAANAFSPPTQGNLVQAGPSSGIFPRHASITQQ